MAVSLVATRQHGAYAAGVATLVGALLINGQAIVGALRITHSGLRIGVT